MNFQNYKPLGIIITAPTLTTAYQASGATTAILDSIQALPLADADLAQYNELVLYAKVSLDTATDVRLILEFSPNNEVDWYQETAQTTSGTTATMTQIEHVFATSGNYIITIPIKFPRGRIRAKATGTVGNGTVTVTAAAGVQ